MNGKFGPRVLNARRRTAEKIKMRVRQVMVVGDQVKREEVRESGWGQR